MPETKYPEYSRNLRLWLVEAVARLPGTFIGKRIIDGIPFWSRLAALLAHLSVEKMTFEKGCEKIVGAIEDALDYLRDAKLEQTFDQAIFLSGFVATKCNEESCLSPQASRSGTPSTNLLLYECPEPADR